MKGFVEITECEAIIIAGGRDPNVAKLVELIGYGVGALMKYLMTARKNRQTALVIRLANGSSSPSR